MKIKTHFQRAVAVFLVIMTLTFSLSGSTLRAATSRVEMIVRGTSLEYAIAAVEQNGGRVAETYAIINAVLADLPATSTAALLKTDGVLGAFPNHKVESAGNPGWGEVEFAESVGAAEVWAEGDLGQDVTVAFLDTGIEPRFASLNHGTNGNQQRILAYYDAIADRTYVGKKVMQSPGDPNGHGTHVAGIVGNNTYKHKTETYFGLAPAANLVAVRALNEQGSGTYADVLRGIQWVIDNKDTYNIRVLNISMYAQPLSPYWADPFCLATMAAWNAGIVVVASAGNGGPTPMSIGVPGNTPYVITVGAFTDNYTPSNFGDDYIPEFSAAGPTVDAFVKPDVIAPGAHIVSLMRHDAYLAQQYPENRIPPFYFKTAGTSMSAAVVSGIAALMLSDNPTLTPDQVKYRLALTARPQFSEFTGEAAYSIWQQGAGRVWAPDAVTTTIQGVANAGMDLTADLAGTLHYQGLTVYDPETEQFHILGYETWAGGYETWAGGYETWAGGYETWAGGTTNWSGSFNDWVAAYQSWSDGWNAWAGGYETWAGAIGDPTWAAAFVNLQNVPGNTTTVGFSWINSAD